jgi:hypothetical protein
MSDRLRDLLARRAVESFVGRERELALMLGEPGAPPPVVTHVHGPAGIGKSSLLHAFAERERAAGSTVITIDCRTIEPTERGFLGELSRRAGEEIGDVHTAVSWLDRLGSKVVLILDDYEVFRLMDTWLRRALLPALSKDVRVVLAGREPPVSVWLTSPEWQRLFRTVVLGPLPADEAETVLRRSGVTDDTKVHGLNRLAHGNPLALRLAASAALDRPGAGPEEIAIHESFTQLTSRFLEGVDDPAARELLRAASVMRRITRPLLEAIRPGVSDDEWELVRKLPFLDACPDGLRIHDALREAVAGLLRSSDPERYLAYRRLAWRQLREGLRTVTPAELWRYTADMLYLIENPVVREAFFPTGEQGLAVEQAREEDHAAVREIIERHEPATMARALEAWWEDQPGAYSVVRDPDGRVVGFYCMCEADALSPRLAGIDPVVSGWVEHLDRDPLPKNEKTLLLRRWLGDEPGESPSSIQAACWLDAKRAYMELRPSLRRVYLTVVDLPTYAPVATELGFRPIESAAVGGDGRTYHTAMLDFGSGSVDAWIARLVASELGIEEDDLLDRDRRALKLGDERIDLTPLEFGLLEYLAERRGQPASRDELLANVWDRKYSSGSNVVDVVVRSLRKKMGRIGGKIETVRGLGYRLSAD